MQSKTRFHKYFNPFLEALRALGGKAPLAAVVRWLAERHPTLIESEAGERHGWRARCEADLRRVGERLSQAGFIDIGRNGLCVLTEKGRAAIPLSAERVSKIAGQGELRSYAARARKSTITRPSRIASPTGPRFAQDAMAGVRGITLTDDVAMAPMEEEPRAFSLDFSALEPDIVPVEDSATPEPAMAPIEPVPETRHVQCKLLAGEAGAEAVKRLQSRRHYRAIIHIGPYVDETGLRADVPFDDSQLPPSERGHDLQIAFCPLDVRVGQDGVVPALVNTIHLPRRGSSGAAEFSFATGEEGRAFRARVLVLHRNRILQTLLLAADVTGEYALRQESVVSPAFAGSPSEAPAELALVINDNPQGLPGITAIAGGEASFSEPAGLGVTIETLKSLLSKANVATAGEALKLDSPELVELMIQLSAHGVALRRELERQIDMPTFTTLTRIQVVEARSKAYLPVEFVYVGKPPKISAQLCPDAGKALATPAACTPGECAHANDAQYLCPAAFWGFSKCIERQPFGLSEQHVFRIPQPGAETLAPFAAAVLAASARVTSNDLRGPDGVEPALAGLTPEVRLANSWEAWKQSVSAKPAASLLVLLPHTDNSPDFVNMPALEIHTDWLTSVELDAEYVNPSGTESAGPLVLLLGCSTALADIAFLNFVREFKGAGAAIVLGTLATIHGTNASRFARTLLGKMKAKSDGRPFDEILLEVKREMLAAGEPFVLSLAAYGHSSWRLQT